MTALTALVVVETILLAILAVVVVALLRSHAEVLRRLPVPDEEHDHASTAHPVTMEPTAGEGGIPEHLPAPRQRVTVVEDIGGRSLEGDEVTISTTMGRPTLVAFLSSGCLTCRTFWEGLRPGVRNELPGGARLVIVVKDPDRESPSKLRELASPGLEVVHSSQAWEDYGITMSPYFCFVDGDTGVVRSEGAAMTWDQVRSLLTDALLDEDLARREAGV